jgi:hypothetical protein
MRRLLNTGFALTVACALMFFEPKSLSAQHVSVNNIFSPFSTTKILGSRPGPRPNWAPECNQGFTEWRPVCAVTRNRVAVTYPNQCMADLDGAVVFDDRECPREVSCPYTYEPVCARVNYPGRRPLVEALKPPPLVAFINECFARTLPDRVKGEIPPPEATEELKMQVTIIRNYGDDLHQYPKQTYHHFGRSTGLEDFSQVCPKSCPEGGLVVCALDHNNVFRLFKNKCSAVMAGASPLRHGDLTKCK